MKKRGISTAQLALAVGVQPPTINRIENAMMRPSPELANKIAKYLAEVGVPITRDQILFPEDYVDVTTRKDGTPAQHLQKAS